MEKLWNRNFVKAMCGNFATFFAFYLLTPLLPLYLNETFGATKDTIGVVLSGYVIAALNCHKPASTIFDRTLLTTKILQVKEKSAFCIAQGCVTELKSTLTKKPHRLCHEKTPVERI